MCHRDGSAQLHPSLARDGGSTRNSILGAVNAKRLDVRLTVNRRGAVPALHAQCAIATGFDFMRLAVPADRSQARDETYL